jgi:probable F420-dependent oxidoreductase
MSAQQRYGITFPFDGMTLLDQRELVRELVDLGYTDLWSAESGGYDAFIPLAVAAQWAPELRLGTAIVPVYTRGAHTLASTVATMCQAAPGRFALGIGSSSNVIVERWNAMTFEKPYQRVRDTIRFLRAALTGEKVTEEYETFAVNGFRLGIPVPEQPPILVAALRQGMLRLAGREGDGAIVNWLSADDVKTVAPHVGAGWETKPKATGGGPNAAGGEPQTESTRGYEIAARIFVFPTDDAGLVYAVGKRAIASYLTVPVYAAFHEWLGRGDQLADLWRLWKEGDRKAAADSIPNEVVDELLVWGKPEQCREHIQRYIDNGVTTPAPALFCGPAELPAVVRALKR